MRPNLLAILTVGMFVVAYAESAGVLVDVLVAAGMGTMVVISMAFLDKGDGQ